MEGEGFEHGMFGIPFQYMKIKRVAMEFLLTTYSNFL